MYRDVTLACDDNQNIQTHKTILVAVSQVEEGLKENNKHRHPLIDVRVGARARNNSGSVGGKWPAASTVPHTSTSTHPNL